jgi:hypothetical protein
VADREERQGAGDFVYVPGNTIHAFKGSGAAGARILIFDAPAASEPFFRDTIREVRDIPADLAKVPEIGARHGLHFLPPR